MARSCAAAATEILANKKHFHMNLGKPTLCVKMLYTSHVQKSVVILEMSNFCICTKLKKVKFLQKMISNGMSLSTYCQSLLQVVLCRSALDVNEQVKN
jgi:hypothetical protein